MRSPLTEIRLAGKRTRWSLTAALAFIALAVLAATALAAVTPKVENPHGKFKGDCGLCHASNGWKPAKISPQFNHAQYGFALTGAHSTAKCMACHASLDFSQGKQLCASCHQDPHRGEMGTDCARCHSARSFQDRSAMVRQHQSTRFPLTGSHAQVDCESCHKPTAQGQMQFVGTKAECQNCHMDQYRSTKNPDHVAGGFPTDCSSCHSTLTWSTKTFDHDKTAFPLTGAHRAVACQQCHGDGVYKGKSTDCYSCHRTDYDGTNAPAHAAAGFPTTCATCHNTTAWGGSSGAGSFNHNTMTTFPLTGAHQALQCAQCHGDGVYKGKSTLCYSCHQTDYTNATPSHPATGFGTQCQTCHTTTTWAGAVFNHNTQTTFPLTGAHQALACNQCHADNVYQGKSTLCYSCHQTDYTNATPNHPSSGFGTDCQTCHTTTTFAGAVFDHSKTAFPLTGAHAAVACNQCHGDGVYQGKSTLCYSCHKADFDGTTDPKHSSAGFATTCENCHGTTVWTTSTFNHNSATTFPLSGAHIALDCNSCHSDNVFKGKSTLCYSCHKADYTGAANPAHATAGFPTQCETCHSTTNWTSSTWSHSTNTTFPLTGAHVPLACNQCHGDNVFKGKSTLCYSCHQADYNTTVVNHTSAGFGTACETCHTTTAWSGGKFTNHDTMFKIYSGRHLGKWSNCTDCHTSTTNYAVFACYGPCHTVSKIDSQHVGRSGYVQGAGDNQKCYSCHKSV